MLDKIERTCTCGFLLIFVYNSTRKQASTSIFNRNTTPDRHNCKKYHVRKTWRFTPRNLWRSGLLYCGCSKVAWLEVYHLTFHESSMNNNLIAILAWTFTGKKYSARTAMKLWECVCIPRENSFWIFAEIRQPFWRVGIFAELAEKLTEGCIKY